MEYGYKFGELMELWYRAREKGEHGAAKAIMNELWEYLAGRFVDGRDK